MRVMVVVTHLLGSGHLVRAVTLADAFQRAGHSAIVVSGGTPVPHLSTCDVEIIQLPPLQSDGTQFTTLLDDVGAPASDDIFTKRINILTDTLSNQRPDVLITELFPFGRRVLRREFNALLRNAKSQTPNAPLICASIRDILAPPSKPSKAQDTATLLEAFYDVVLVHSDQNLMPLEASWPITNNLSEMLEYTGFIAPPATSPHRELIGSDEILVSAGGGNVGQSIYLTALEAATKDHSQRWRLLVGGTEANSRCADLSAHATDNVSVEPARPDFREMLHCAACSVSMCGYNTAMDVLQSNVPAVFVPFDAGNEVEQSLRAASLSKLNGIETIRERELSANRLLELINLAQAAPRRDPAEYRLDGALTSVKVVEALFEDKLV